MKTAPKPLKEFVDAQAMMRLHPTTFGAPSQSALDRLKAGEHVKVCVGNERFWIKLTVVEGNKLAGTIDNDLVCTDEHGLMDGDLVEFEKRHIYGTLT